MILVKENKPAEIAEFCELHGLNAEVGNTVQYQTHQL